MEAYIPNEPSKKPSKNTIIIAALIGALFLQFFYFSHRVKTVEKNTRAPQNTREAVQNSPDLPQPHFRTRSSSASRASANVQSHSTPLLDSFFNEDPFSELEKIHSRIYQMMNTARAYAPFVMQQMSQDMSSDFIPAIDMEESPNAYTVRCDIPGLEKEKIDITTKNNTLIIQGVRESQTHQKDDQGGYYAVERSYGSFARTVPLPGPVDEANIKADYKNGVLTIVIPKAAQDTPKAKKIPVQ